MASEFSEWVQIRIDVYISHRKYQINPHSSPCFSTVCGAAIVHRNRIFICTKRINLLNLNKVQTGLSLPKDLLILFSTKLNLLYLLYSTARRCCLLHLIKQNYLLKTFLRTLILTTQVSLYLIFPRELI